MASLATKVILALLLPSFFTYLLLLLIHFSQNIIDPTDKEEQCLKGSLIVATNKRHEICALHQSGNFLLSEQLVSQYCSFTCYACFYTIILISAKVSVEEYKLK